MYCSYEINLRPNVSMRHTYNNNEDRILTKVISPKISYYLHILEMNIIIINIFYSVASIILPNFQHTFRC